MPRSARTPGWQCSLNSPSARSQCERSASCPSCRRSGEVQQTKLTFWNRALLSSGQMVFSWYLMLHCSHSDLLFSHLTATKMISTASSGEVVKNVRVHLPVGTAYPTLNQSIALVVHVLEGSGSRLTLPAWIRPVTMCSPGRRLKSLSWNALVFPTSSREQIPSSLARHKIQCWDLNVVTPAWLPGISRVARPTCPINLFICHTLPLSASGNFCHVLLYSSYLLTTRILHCWAAPGGVQGLQLQMLHFDTS